MFQYICEEHFQRVSGGRSVFTNLKASTHFGRPHLGSMFKTVHRAHPMVNIFITNFDDGLAFIRP